MNKLTLQPKWTILTCLFILITQHQCTSSPKSDRIESLPMYGPPPSPQYSGFLNASSSTDGTFLHYWFAMKKNSKESEMMMMTTTTTERILSEEEDDEKKTPVIIWLNGGPGSSSILGMLQELGPLLIRDDDDGKGLIENPYSWTELGHVLILESPAGVGYSYCKNTTNGSGGCYNTDKSTARDARAAVVDFFSADKFPELRSNPLIITGESYAGVYVPTLAREILDYNDGVEEESLKVNLVGVAVGDPCTDNRSQRDSMDMLWYSHKYGFVPDDEFDLLWNRCNVRLSHPLALGVHRGRDKERSKDHDAAAAAAAAAADMFAASSSLGSDDPECILAHRKFLLQSSNGISQEWSKAYINNLSLYGPSAVVRWDVPGSLNYYTAQYMNRQDVRKALHVDIPPLAHREWPGPDLDWIYVSEYDACNDRVDDDDDQSTDRPLSMIDFYRYIAPKLRTTVVYNGDTDPCVSYEGTRIAIQKVGFSVIEGGSYRPWFYNATSTDLDFLSSKPLLFGPALSIKDAGVQYGGHVINYENNLMFVTVHGSGHMVPQFRPRSAFRLLQNVLLGAILGNEKEQEEKDDESLSIFAPLVCSDEELSSMSDEEFRVFMNSWTEQAMNLV